MSPTELLTRWMHLVNSQDLEPLLALYDERAVLIPTFSNRLLSTPERIREYFVTLCSREELTISLHEKTVIAREIRDGIVDLCGIYRWGFKIDDEPMTFEARFSYVLDVQRPRPILHHHSSQIPRML